MRSKSARLAWISIDTESMLPMGKKSRLCSVVNATIVPAVIGALGPWLPESTKPAMRYTSAGALLKNAPMTANSARPIISWRMARLASR